MLEQTFHEQTIYVPIIEQLDTNNMVLQTYEKQQAITLENKYEMMKATPQLNIQEYCIVQRLHKGPQEDYSSQQNQQTTNEENMMTQQG